jgi:hypothetical protein
MSEPLLRLAYLAIGIYGFASALLTQMILGRPEEKSAVALFSMSSIWVSFLAFVLLVGWMSKLTNARTGDQVPESFLRTSFLTMGLFFFACALASTMTLTNNSATAPDWYCVGGLWIGFGVFSSLTSVISKSKGSAHLTPAVAATA